MNTIVLDLETYRTRNQDVINRVTNEAIAKRPANNTAAALKQIWDAPEQIERRVNEALNHTAVDVLIAEPLVVCLDIDGTEETYDAMKNGETETLTLLSALLNNATQHTVWVGHNIGFDLAVLLNRWRRWRIPISTWFPDYRRHWRGRIHDTMESTPCMNGLNLVKLETVCEAYGLPAAKSVVWNGSPMEGSRVGDAFRGKQYDLICEYCMADVRATKALYGVQTNGKTTDIYTEVVGRLKAVDEENISEGAAALTKLQILESCGFF